MSEISEEGVYVVEDDTLSNGQGELLDEGTYGEVKPDGTWTDKGDPEKKPSVHTKRTPVSDLFALLWGGAGMYLARSGTDIGVGRVMQFQAPLAGTKFDEVIAGTWLDNALQPFVKHADKVEGLGAVILFPLLVGAYERNPAIGPMVEPILRQVVRSTLLDMAPVMRKQKSDVKRAAATVGDLNDVFDLPKDIDPVDAVLGGIFEGVWQTTPPAEEESA